MADTDSTPSAPLSPLAALGQAITAAAPQGSVLDARVTRRAETAPGELVVRLRREAVLPVMLMLRDDPRFAFEQCMDICGVDWPGRAERFEVVWNLLSLRHNHRVRVIASTDENTPVPSVAAIWPTATWFEREAWDMYGILFAGQTDLRRLLTDYGFEGHPLRKDFPLTGHVEVRYDSERREVVYEPVKLTQEFRQFDFLSPWEGMTTLPGDEKVHLNRLPPPEEGPADEQKEAQK
ncbi:NADH-quinone oxidoreductase subunit C [Roseomonas gilardii subsp. gilardii]|uniref:NADH-quinone oxidoreductase subunit C n=1 Tax=Roseomonas gilardii TaxID=257708 RepID=UPI001FFB9E09|nr:NADH-quinone oxidoreductase subunit C [Roseomonas gilardii]UPG71837.1 NADH-quinone oxidoreductase subunit C [Roseomonas gilardii subsp. gilardii]